MCPDTENPHVATHEAIVRSLVVDDAVYNNAASEVCQLNIRMPVGIWSRAFASRWRGVRCGVAMDAGDAWRVLLLATR